MKWWGGTICGSGSQVYLSTFYLISWTLLMEFPQMNYPYVIFFSSLTGECYFSILVITAHYHLIFSIDHYLENLYLSDSFHFLFLEVDHLIIIFSIIGARSNLFLPDLSYLLFSETDQSTYFYISIFSIVRARKIHKIDIIYYII